ncbi:MAG: monomeric [FeFe] hydrogenase [Bacillota bacterium]
MKDRIFDTRVQLLKYKVLKEVINCAYDENFDNIYVDAPKKILPGPKSELRCCIYKGRAVLQERISLAMGGDKNPNHVMEVMDIACDECPAQGHFVTDLCRSCISHMCMESCPRDAIYISKKNKAKIDKTKCIECGKCQKACPYGAIMNSVRPCVRACKVGAIEMNEQDKAVINYDKCVSCGQCGYKCPFGAIADKSYVKELVGILKHAVANGEKVFAVIAPAIVSQFKYAKIGQIITGMKYLGFHEVVEAALGADIVLEKEVHEFGEREIMTTSCCPAYVSLVEKHFPTLKHVMSTSRSPMLETALIIKEMHPGAKVVFIGPCTAKKYEFKRPEHDGIIDCVITFEELQAFLDARQIDIADLEEGKLDNASYYGRIFAKSSGIAQGFKDIAQKNGVTKEIKPLVCNGLEEAKVAFLKLRAGRLDANLVEVMACEGGCVNGSACLHRNPKRELDVEVYAKKAKESDIDKSVSLYETVYGKKIEDEHHEKHSETSK